MLLYSISTWSGKLPTPNAHFQPWLAKGLFSGESAKCTKSRPWGRLRVHQGATRTPMDHTTPSGCWVDLFVLAAAWNDLAWGQIHTSITCHRVHVW